ncbi:hypothetical protein GCK32_001444 [Trichostrongylus colubriformis]|uniref:SAM-dependent MTase TRM10-type domain-containing protein n=1 Tax=Trichostrongylus colubriformis TaxID=6319 RepID=A0AAN8IDS8_TRICO
MNNIEVAGNTFQYAELNIRHTGNAEKTLAMVKRAVRMGYDAVAINIDIGDIAPGELVEEHMISQTTTENNDKPPPKKKRKGEDKKPREQQLPDPFLVNESLLDLGDLEKQGKRFRQFSRITFTLNDASVIHNVFNNPRLRRFDIVAVRPSDVNILNTLTRKTDAVDIISMNPETHVGWLHKAKFLERIRIEGVGFEITYAPALTPANRRSCLHSGRFLLRGLRGRGVILSSGASSMCELRAPVDVMNMAILWGVTGADARLLISGNAKQILLRAEARRTVGGVLHVASLEMKVDKAEQKTVDASIPACRATHTDALQRLLKVKEFRAQRELEREKDLVKKCLKTPRPIRENQEETDHVLYYPAPKLAKDQRSMAWQRVARAHRCGHPSLVVDCRFLPLLSPRSAELTTVQLKYMISENRDSRHLSVIDSPSTCSPVVFPRSFTDLFERERIIYLSPDAEEEIEDVHADDVYVLGGIVDRVIERGISRQASLETAIAERVRSKKLPLDKYVTNIPVRNIRSAEEKSIAGRILHDKIRQFDRQLLQLVEREIGKEAIRDKI